MSTKILDRIAEVHDEVVDAELVVAKLMDKRDNLIRQAFKKGVPGTAIAATSGLSVPRVYQVKDYL